MKTTVPIPARYYARLCDFMLQQGMPVSAWLERAGITPGQLHAPEATLPLAHVERLVHALLETTGRPDLALDLGRVIKLTSHNMVGYAMLSSPSVEYALGLIARFFQLIMPPFRMRTQRQDGHLLVSFEPVMPMSRACRLLHFEAIASATHWEVRELLQGQLPPYDLHLPFAEPRHVARYEELTGARCHFMHDARPLLYMRFPVDICLQAPSLADPTALHMAEARCRDMAHQIIRGGGMTDWVRTMLRDAGDGMLTLTDLAGMLSLSPRTLDRHLKAEGTSFRELARAARLTRAMAMLDDTSLAITRIAYELGYSDAANFTRAMRRDAGMTPAEYRRRQQAQLSR